MSTTEIKLARRMESLNFTDFDIDEDSSVRVLKPMYATCKADLLLKIMSGETCRAVVPLHKAFMTENVPYFTSMFKTGSTWREAKVEATGDDKKESNPYMIIQYVYDGDLDVLEQYFTSIYSQCVKLEPTTVIQFFKIADYFNDELILRTCIDYLKNNITEQLIPAAWECSQDLEAPVNSFLKKIDQNGNNKRSTVLYPFTDRSAFITNMSQLSPLRFERFIDACSTNPTLSESLGWELIVEVKVAWYVANEKTLDNMIFSTDWSVLTDTSRLNHFKAAVHYLDPTKIRDDSSHIFG